ncbi:MAG: heme biosynthesis HemY N-terminal domain-containing protein [Burkholderiaceae bacterium]
MRWLTWTLLLALLAATAALVLQVNAGNVAFLLPPYRIDVSLNLFLIVLVVALGLVYWIARAVQKLADFPERVRLYRTRREEVGGQQALVEAARSLLEGRFARAEKAARAAQSSSSTAAVAALIGARAAHRMQEYERRDEWLRLSEGDAAAETARLVSSAEMWTEQRNNEAALRAIERLQGSGARHLHAMRIALNANVQLGRWEDVLRSVRSLEKRKALHPILAAKLKLNAYRQRLEAQRLDPASLEQAWRSIPQAEREAAGLAYDGSRLLNVAGRGRLAAEAIEQALQAPPADWDAGAELLLDEYARAQSFPSRAQLERVEQWLKQPPRSAELHAALLRTAGLLCLREQLWGKSSAYLAESLQLLKHPATFLALARLADAVGNAADADTYFREAALGYAKRAGESGALVPSAMRDLPV